MSLALPPQQKKPRGKRHGFHLTCQTCQGAESIIGGIENPKKFSKIITEHKRIHRNHVYELKQSYHAAELEHVSLMTNASRQTMTNTTFVDVTNGSIAAVSFTASKKYLITVTATVDAPVVANGANIRVVHGGTPTAFDDSAMTWFSSNTTNNKITYAWWTVFTQPGTAELVKAQISNTTTGTTGIDHVTVTAIKLSDDLTENTDWYHNEVTANVALTNGDTATSNAVETFTPAVASQDWLVMSKSRIDVSAITSVTGSRIVRSGEGSSTGPHARYEQSNAAAFNVFALSRVFTLGNASNTFTEKSFSTASAHTRTHSGIFALNLSMLRNESNSYDDGSIQDLSAGNWGTTVRTVNITPDVAGDVWVLGMFTVVFTATTHTMKGRIQLDNSSSTEFPAGVTTDTVNIFRANDATDEYPIMLQGMTTNLSAASHTYDLDGSVSSATAGRGARCKSLFAVTMELASTGTAFVEIDPATVGITEASDRIRGRISNLAETIGLVEASNRTMDRTRMLNEIVGLQEAINRLRGRFQQPAETVGLQEALNTLRARLAVIPTETVGITEASNFLRSRIAQLQDTIGLSEQITLLRGRIANINETLGLSETFNEAMNRVRIINETVGLTEALNATRQLNQIINETVGFTDTENYTRALVRTLNTETVGFTENANTIKNILKVLDETVGISDAQTIARNIVKMLDETVGLTETTNTTRALMRTLDETVGLTEAINTRSDLVRIINENVALQETINRIVSKSLVIDETVGLTEAVNTARDLVRIINETVQLAEAVNFARNYVKIVNETVGLTDTVNKVRGLIKQVDETVGLTEALNTALNKLEVSNDTVGLTEAINTLRSRKVIADDTIGLTEAINYIRSRVQVINETVGLVEQVNTIRNRIMSINEDIGLAEAHNIARNLVRIQNEQIGVTEQLAQSRNLSRIIDEAVGILENVSYNLNLTRVVNETLGLTEAINTAANKVRIINETVGIEELVNSVLVETGVGEALTKVIDESLNISEAINRIKGLNVTINENVSLSEADIVFARGLSRTIDENVGLIESLNRVAHFVRVINESVFLSEALNTAQNLAKTINETVDIAETANYVRALAKVVNETVGLSETQMSALGKVKVINEAIDVLENIVNFLDVNVFVAPEIPTPSYNMALSPARRRRFTTRVQRPQQTKVIQPTPKVKAERLKPVRNQLKELKEELKKREQLKGIVEISLTLRWNQAGATSISALLDRLVVNAMEGKTQRDKYKEITTAPRMRQSAIILQERPPTLLHERIDVTPLPIKSTRLAIVESALSIRYNTIQLADAYPLILNWQILNDVNTQLVVKSTIEDSERWQVEEIMDVIGTVTEVTNAMGSIADIQKKSSRSIV